MTRLKTYVTNPVERPPAGGAFPFYALEHVASGTGQLLPDAEIEPKEDDTSVLHRPGDVRFGKLRPYLAKSLLMTDKGIGSAELLVLRPRACTDSQYLHYLTLSKPFVEWATATSYGVKMPRTNWEALANLLCEFPPLEVQRSIVAELDRHVASIDSLVEEQQALAALVEERLDGVREDVFRRWPERRLKEALAVSPTYGVLVPVFVEEGVPFVRVGDLTNLANPEVPERAIDPALSAQHRRTVLRGGEVLVSVVGSLGHAGVVPSRLAGANVARAVAVLRVNYRLTSPLLAHFVRTRRYQDQAALATGSDTAQPTLGMGDLSNFAIPLPPTPDELSEASERLDAEGAAAAKLLSEIGAQIGLLREHRQALITAAVTGGLRALDQVA